MRGAGLEGRFLHVVAAGNIYPNLLIDTARPVRQPRSSPPRKSPLPVAANLAEHDRDREHDGVRSRRRPDPARSASRDTSKRGGDISTVGNDIKSLGAPGVAARPRRSAAPRARRRRPRAPAASLWALAPALTPGAGRRDPARDRAPPVDAGHERPALRQPRRARAGARRLRRRARRRRRRSRSPRGRGARRGRRRHVRRAGPRGLPRRVRRLGRRRRGRPRLRPLRPQRRRLHGRRPRPDRPRRDARRREWTFSRRREVLGLEIGHDETVVRDLDVLCHEANGPLYAGDVAGARHVRRAVLPAARRADRRPGVPGHAEPGPERAAAGRRRGAPTSPTRPSPSSRACTSTSSQTSGTLGAVDRHDRARRRVLDHRGPRADRRLLGRRSSPARASAARSWTGSRSRPPAAGSSIIAARPFNFLVRQRRGRRRRRRTARDAQLLRQRERGGQGRHRLGDARRRRSRSRAAGFTFTGVAEHRRLRRRWRGRRLELHGAAVHRQRDDVLPPAGDAPGPGPRGDRRRDLARARRTRRRTRATKRIDVRAPTDFERAVQPPGTTR